jgi:hypothetical protein
LLVRVGESAVEMKVVPEIVGKKQVVFLYWGLV